MNHAERLRKAAELADQRSAVYKDNFKRIGKLMMIHFPEGVTLKTEDDFIRYHLFVMGELKHSRYGTNFHNGGHEDSLMDEAVYSAMLAEYDATEAQHKHDQGITTGHENIIMGVGSQDEFDQFIRMVDKERGK